MYIEQILKAADFSKETNFKEKLYSEFNNIFSDGEIDDEDLTDVVAARGGIVVSALCQDENISKGKES